MKIQVNSDKTIAVDVRLTRFVEGEVTRTLGRFAKKLTRMEVHLSDVDSKKTGQADKRCLIEVRPAGARPLSASAKATKMAAAVAEALGKIRRSLTTFFGRTGRLAAAVPTHVSPAKKAPVQKAAKSRPEPEPEAKAAVKNTAARKPAAPGIRRPKKKQIYQARRKPWPSR